MNQNEVHHLVVSAANAFAKYARAKRDMAENPTQEGQVALEVLRSDYHAKRDAVLAAKGKKVAEGWAIYFPGYGFSSTWATKEDAQSCIDGIDACNAIVVKITALVPV